MQFSLYTMTTASSLFHRLQLLNLQTWQHRTKQHYIYSHYCSAFGITNMDWLLSTDTIHTVFLLQVKPVLKRSRPVLQVLPNQPTVTGLAWTHKRLDQSSIYKHIELGLYQIWLFQIQTETELDGFRTQIRLELEPDLGRTCFRVTEQYVWWN